MSNREPRIRTIAWRGEDDPERLDVARFALWPGALQATGSSVTAGYALRWHLTTSSDWVTDTLTVEVDGEAWSRRLALRREPSGRWEADAQVEGGADLGVPGLVDPRDVAGALDCDLGLCPATNTMPVLRLGLTGPAPAPATEAVMALVEVPSLRVVRSVQTYGLLSRQQDAGSIVSFAAAPDFTTELRVDQDGLVVEYPGLAAAIAPPHAVTSSVRTAPRTSPG